MKKFRYHINPETEQPHIYDHGVTEDEVEEVFEGWRQVYSGSNRSRIVLGKTAAGRFLTIISKPDHDGIGIFIITAYDLQGKHLRTFRRSMRRRFG